MKHISDARNYDNKGFQFTRRIIALTAVFFIIAWPKLVPVFFDTSVYLTWTEFSRGFLFLVEQKEMTMDKEFFGVVITPLDTHLMSAIIGLYFGGSLVKKKFIISIFSNFYINCKLSSCMGRFNK